VRQISNPVGAVTVISAVKLLPDTAKFCAAEAIPEQAAKAERVPVVVMVGPKLVIITIPSVILNAEILD
jgi:hypothetical protein